MFFHKSADHAADRFQERLPQVPAHVLDQARQVAKKIPHGPETRMHLPLMYDGQHVGYAAYKRVGKNGKPVLATILGPTMIPRNSHLLNAQQLLQEVEGQKTATSLLKPLLGLASRVGMVKSGSVMPSHGVHAKTASNRTTRILEEAAKPVPTAEDYGAPTVPSLPLEAGTAPVHALEKGAGEDQKKDRKKDQPYDIATDLRNIIAGKLTEAGTLAASRRISESIHKMAPLAYDPEASKKLIEEAQKKDPDLLFSHSNQVGAYYRPFDRWLVSGDNVAHTSHELGHHSIHRTPVIGRTLMPSALASQHSPRLTLAARALADEDSAVSKYAPYLAQIPNWAHEMGANLVGLHHLNRSSASKEVKDQGKKDLLRSALFYTVSGVGSAVAQDLMTRPVASSRTFFKKRMEKIKQLSEGQDGKGKEQDDKGKEKTASTKTKVFAGLRVRIDRPKGHVQKGKDPKGDPWTRTYLCDYGYLAGTQGGDGAGMDVFLGPQEDGKAFLFSQHKEDGSFDEYKLLLGFPDLGSAREMYEAHVPQKYIGKAREIPLGVLQGLTGMPVNQEKAAQATFLHSFNMHLANAH